MVHLPLLIVYLPLLIVYLPLLMVYLPLLTVYLLLLTVYLLSLVVYLPSLIVYLPLLTADDPTTGQNWMLVETDNAPRPASEPPVGCHPPLGEQHCTLSQPKCVSSNSPTSGAPSKKRLADWSTTYTMMQELDQER